MGRNTTRKDDLIKSENTLDAAHNFVTPFEPLEERRGYDTGKQFRANVCKGGIQEALLDHWLSDKPDTYILEDGYN